MTARVREGRAVMLEGNPDHPLSRGGLCPVGQASIETLYGPGRLGSPWAGGKPAAWPDAEKALAAGLRTALDSGKAVVVLTRPEPGLLGDLLTRWLAALGQPATHGVVFDFMARPWLREGQRRALGSDAVPVHRFEEARLILSVGDDLVEEGSPVEAARGLAEQRAAGGRSIYVGPRLSLTAASCDEWISVEPGSELTLVLGLCRQVLQQAPAWASRLSLGSALGERLARFDPETVAARTGLKVERIKALAQALLDHRPGLVLGPGRALAGSQADRLSEAVHVLNALLGNARHHRPSPGRSRRVARVGPGRARAPGARGRGRGAGDSPGGPARLRAARASPRCSATSPSWWRSPASSTTPPGAHTWSSRTTTSSSPGATPRPGRESSRSSSR